MRIIRTLLAVLVSAMLIVGCGTDDDEQNGVAYPKISLRLAPGVQHAVITRVVLTVSGPDMEPEEFEFDIDDGGKTASGTVSVASGENRLFTVTAYSGDGVEAQGEMLVRLLEPGTELLLEISLEVPGGDNGVPEGTPVSIEVLIRRALDKPQGLLTEADYESVEALSSEVEEVVTDIIGIERCINLERLFLFSVQVSDLRPLSGLTHLTQFSVAGGTNISDISPLSGPNELMMVTLYDTKVTDFSPLSRMAESDYSQLSLGGSQVNEAALLSVLKDLRSLTTLHLNIYDSAFTDNSVLSRFADLDGLYLTGEQVTDRTLTAVVGLANLNTLGLFATQVTAFSQLSRMVNLTLLYLADQGLSDLGFLSGMTNLDQLYLDDNQISDLTPLSRLGLVILSLNNNQVSDISPLMSMELAWLNLRGNPLSAESINTHIPLLRANGTTVDY